MDKKYGETWNCSSPLDTTLWDNSKDSWYWSNSMHAPSRHMFLKPFGSYKGANSIRHAYAVANVFFIFPFPFINYWIHEAQRRFTCSSTWNHTIWVSGEVFGSYKCADSPQMAWKSVYAVTNAFFYCLFQLLIFSIILRRLEGDSPLETLQKVLNSA